MKESKAVYVTKRDLKDNLLRPHFQLYPNTVITAFDVPQYEQRSKDVAIQHNSKRDNLICTCKKLSAIKKHPEGRYFSSSKQIYTYHRSKSFTDIGVGSVKAFQKKKVKRIYLPETDDRGVGSSDLTSFFNRKIKQNKLISYYDTKTTSSKCVGGVFENKVECVMSANLSPIIQTIAGTTSPKASLAANLQEATKAPVANARAQNTETASNTQEKHLVTTDTQIETEEVKSEIVEEVKTPEPQVIKLKSIIKKSSNIESKDAKTSGATTSIEKITDKKFMEEKSFSSDSLVQHVHNLENPSEVKSIDPMENKLEREYRKIFAAKSKEKGESHHDKPIPDFKSASVLRRRFEALRRTLGKKDSKKNFATEATPPKLSSQGSVHDSSPSHRDVSVTSDPPSLEERSYSNSKMYRYSPYPDQISNNSKQSYNKSCTSKKDREWSRTNTVDSEFGQGVKGMFKLWGKKFNLEEDYYGKKNTPGSSFETAKNKKPPDSSVETVKRAPVEENKKKPPQKERVPPPEVPAKPAPEEKKEGKKFFFFNKKSNKDKPKATYKSKKGVTTGRCEVRDGLIIKIGGSTPVPPVKKAIEKRPESYEEILRKAWLMKYLTNPIESKKSVQVRWNNKTYATSSSTVFALMENVYKEQGIVLKSKSEIATDESSYYKSYPKQNVNFVQNVEAWMIPKLIPDYTIPETSKQCESNATSMEVSISDQKWLIDKSKALAHKIEVVLHSNNFVNLRNPDVSSEYLRIDIPKGFFSDTSSEDPQQPIQTSDEEVYKIVEYETPNSIPELKNLKTKNLVSGDNNLEDIEVTISVKDNSLNESKILETVIKRPPMHRDVVIQGSNVYIPKKCDVIGVGIITQRDVREVKKSILKIVEYDTDDESEHSVHKQKKCEFAESYLQDYYRNWAPLNIDLFSWCVSDTHLKCSSGTESHASWNNGDGSKSCPNMCDDYLDPTVVSSCVSSSCSQSIPQEAVISDQGQENATFYNKLRKNKTDGVPAEECKRVLPKDSLEVYRKRKLYAHSKKSSWGGIEDRPYSVPSIEDRGTPDTLTGCPNPSKPYIKQIKSRKKPCKKHVSLPNCDLINDMLTKRLSEKIPVILALKGSAGCDACKLRVVKCSKHARVDASKIVTIPDPSCKMFCDENSQPKCMEQPPSGQTSPRCQSTTCLPSPSLGSHKAPVSPGPCPHLNCTHSPKCPHTNTQRPQKIPPPPKSKASPCFCPSPSPSPLLCGPSQPPSRSPPPCPSPPPYLTPPMCPPLRPSCPSGIRITIHPSPPSSPPPSQPPYPSPPHCPSKSGKPPPCFKPPPCTKPPPPGKKPSPSSPPSVKPPPCAKPPPNAKSPPSAKPLPCAKPPPNAKSPPNAKPLPCAKPPPNAKSPPNVKPPPSAKPSPCAKPPPCPKPPTHPNPTPPSKKPSPPEHCCHSPQSKESLMKRDTKSPPSCATSCRGPMCSSPPSRPGSPFHSTCGKPKTKSDCYTTPSKDKKKNDETKKNKEKENPTKEKKKAVCQPGIKCASSIVSAASSKEFPWPTKNQVSNQASYDRCPPVDSPCKSKEECDKNCLSSPESSQPSVTKQNNKEKKEKKKKEKDKKKKENKEKDKKEKDCKPDCANRRKSSSFPLSPPPRCPRPEYVLPQIPSSPTQCPPICTESKISGIFLRKNPSKKNTSPEDCKATEQVSPNKVIHLNSKEKITIKLKSPSPSTDTIRRPLGIKMTDEDGQTLCERRDYRRSYNSSDPTYVSPNSRLSDMYCDTSFNRVLTPLTVNKVLSVDRNQVESKSKSDTSIANLIEINFKLRVTQGDKTTEVNIGNEDEKETKNKSSHLGKTSQEVFVCKDDGEPIEENSKNDINIRILIKNYNKSKEDKQRKRKYASKSVIDDEFSRKISAKFLTVSTGYSNDFKDERQETSNVFSVHRATIDLTSSTEQSKIHIKSSDTSMTEKSKSEHKTSDNIMPTKSAHVSKASIEKVISKSSREKTSSKSSLEIMSEILSKHLELNIKHTGQSLSVTEQSGIDTSISRGKSDDLELKRSVSSKKTSEIKTVVSSKIEKLYDKSEARISITDTDDQDASETYNKTSTEPDTDLNVKTSEEPTAEANIPSLPEIKAAPKTRLQEKKEMLKAVFENANYLKKPKNKSRIKKLKDMLKAILTSDSSDHDEIVVVTTNELATDLTYASLKPNFFKNSDSLNNYFKGDSTVASERDSNIRMIYPTEEFNSECSGKESDEWSIDYEKPINQGCICSTLAERLKICNDEVGAGCCCKRKQPHQDEETNCDIRNEEDYLLLNYKSAECIDVETQHSKQLCNKVNSTNVSIHNNIQYVDVPVVAQFSNPQKSFKIIQNDVRDNKVSKTFSPHSSYNYKRELINLDKNNKLGISDDDKIVFLEGKVTKVSLETKIAKEMRQKEKRHGKCKHRRAKSGRPVHPSDILQLYETKKAVLEIYAEKTVTDDGEHMVAKLPKFVYERESEICRNYEDLSSNNFKNVCKRNIVMMSIGR